MRAIVLTAVATLLALGNQASADGWGTIKGQVVFADPIKKPEELNVDKDKMHCLSKGPLLSQEYVIDPKTKGVRWVMVWIAADNNGKSDHMAKLPIHPKVVVPTKQVVMDQPCCMFVPRMLGLVKGQDFIGKNSSPIAHNMSLIGRSGPNVNQILPPGAMTVAAEKWGPDYIPVSVSCGIHPWMNSKVFCFKHPYFCVTDEQGKFEIKNVPAGQLRLILWHESQGVLLTEKGKKSFDGKGITVEDGKTLDLGKVLMKYPVKKD